MDQVDESTVAERCDRGLDIRSSWTIVAGKERSSVVERWGALGQHVERRDDRVTNRVRKIRTPKEARLILPAASPYGVRTADRIVKPRPRGTATHCPRGHDRSIHMRRRRSGRNVCAACNNERSRRPQPDAAWHRDLTIKHAPYRTIALSIPLRLLASSALESIRRKVSRSQLLRDLAGALVAGDTTAELVPHGRCATIQISIPIVMLAAIDAFAVARGLSRSKVFALAAAMVGAGP